MPNVLTVYVALLKDGTEVWRPVHAEHLGDDCYRLIEGAPDGEMWQFTIGDIVQCKERTLKGDRTRHERVVAYEKVR